MIKEKILSRSVRMMCAGGVAVGMGMFVQPAFAQEQPMARVEITGSSLKRVDSETALPVQVVTREEIARTGATSTEELLNSISALSSSGATANSTGAGSSTYGVSSISLRGLGDERTLVLVNGRRLAAFAGGGGATVNVNVIPLAAIERIEVLKDGASGVYGSDAVAGVVNFILSKKFTGLEATVGYASPFESGGGKTKKASVTGGFGDLDKHGFSVVLSASQEKETALFAKDREFARTGNRPPYLLAAATGHGNIEGAIIPGAYPNDRVSGQFGNSPGAGFGNPLADPDNCAKILMFKNPDPSTRGAPYCAFDSNAFVGLIPQRKLTNVTGNLTVKLGENAELFADGIYSKSTVLQDFQGSPLRRSFMETDALFLQNGVDPALILYPSNPNYQSIAAPYLTAKGYGALVGKPLAITSRVFDYGGRKSLDEGQQSRVVAGVRGTFEGQDYEIAVTNNKSRLHGSVPGGYFSMMEYARIINDPANNWNPWAENAVQTGALAEKLKAAQYTGDTLRAVSKSQIFDAKVAGDLPQFAGITSQYAVGIQSRHENYVTTPSPALETGDIAGLGGSVPPVARSRTINSAFAEINVPITSKLDVGGAFRRDLYNDVGGSSNAKLSARWQPIRQVLLRASAGTGFRAPTLSDLWEPQTLGTSAEFTDPNTNQDLQVNELTGGNSGLKPEESKQLSFGAVLSPFENFTVGVDFFKIKVEDILSTPSTQEVVSRFRSGDPAYAGQVKLVDGEIDSVINLMKNTGNADVRGADIFATYRMNTGVGRFDFGLNGTWMERYDQTSPGGTLSRKVGTIVEANGDPVIGADDGGVVLRWRHALSGTYTRGAFGVTLTQNWSSGYETGNDLNGDRHFIKDQQLYDLNVSYRGVRNLTVSAGVRNLFDKQPQMFIPVSNQFQAGYDITQYDPRGRLAYVTLGYKFK